MPRTERAKQFGSFDALKGLQDALRLKEYEHERIIKGEVNEEMAKKISKIFLELEKTDILEVVYFSNGHNKKITGTAKLLLENQTLEISKTKIYFDDILEIDKIN